MSIRQDITGASNGGGVNCQKMENKFLTGKHLIRNIINILNFRSGGAEVIGSGKQLSTS